MFKVIKNPNFRIVEGQVRMITSVLLFMSDSPSPYGARDAVGGETGKKTGLEALRGHRTMDDNTETPL